MLINTYVPLEESGNWGFSVKPVAMSGVELRTPNASPLADWLNHDGWLTKFGKKKCRWTPIKSWHFFFFNELVDNE